ncbi:Uma2 family endonuclease [Streptomyces sp. NPDC050504]|uniref:Uma2 family endonuclease n=1 Tax=Streptomyces sp. NPDC050504 TaxID=3365618 RepID=UPI00378BA649
MTALAHEAPEIEATVPESPVRHVPDVPDLDEVLWQAWKAMELPEGFRAEIIEGAIEVSPTGRANHGRIHNRLRRALDAFLAESEYAAYQDFNVVHDRKVWIPDIIVAPEDDEPHLDEDGLGFNASAVALVVEVVSPGHRDRQRDRARKRREYARAGIPVYVLVDSHDEGGTVTVLTGPNPKKGDWVGEHRVPYGTGVTVPDGPLKGFAVTEDITGPVRPKD